MEPGAVWTIAAFIVGLIVGVLSTIAAFRASVAVLGTESKANSQAIRELRDSMTRLQEDRAADVERARKEVAEAVDPIRRGLANIMLRLGNVHRWEDARDIIGAADLDKLNPGGR